MTLPSDIKVLHVSWSLKTGGLEQVILNLVRSGLSCGILPQVAVMEEEGNLLREIADLGVKTHFLHKKPGLDWRMAPALKKLCQEEGIQVLHAHNTGPGLYTALAARWLGCPSLVTRHGKSFQTGWRMGILRRIVGRLAQATVCVGRDVLAQSNRVDLVPADRLFLVMNGVDVDAIAAAGEHREEMRRELGLGEDDFLVITVARLDPIKDLGVLLTAIREGAENFPGLRLVVVGDGRERANLEQRAAQLGLSERVAFLGKRRDVPRLLSAADAYALSSLSEGISIAVLEAMAAGLPIVGTEVDGMYELIERNVTGFLAPISDPSALAQRLAGLAADPARAREMGRSGHQRARELFSIQAMCNSYRKVYEHLLGRPGADCRSCRV